MCANSLGWRASQVECGEQHLDALPGAGQKDVQALARDVHRIVQQRCGERPVLRAARSRHERLVALCVGK